MVYMIALRKPDNNDELPVYFHPSLSSCPVRGLAPPLSVWFQHFSAPSIIQKGPSEYDHVYDPQRPPHEGKPNEAAYKEHESDEFPHFAFLFFLAGFHRLH